MKKFIKRLFGIFLGVIFCCHNLCYADVITVSEELTAGGMLLIPVGIIVFIIIMISYISLKIIAKKEETQGQINEDTQKKIENDKKYLSICIFALTIIISTIIYLINRGYYPWIPLILVIVFLIIAINYRVKEKKIFSYLLYAIAVVIFAVTCIYGNNVKNEAQERKKQIANYEIDAFNSKITPYIGESISGSQVNSLIQLVVAINIQSLRDYDWIKKITVVR